MDTRDSQAQEGFMPLVLEALLMCTGGKSLAEVHYKFDQVEDTEITSQASFRSLRSASDQGNEQRQGPPNQRNRETRRVLYSSPVPLFQDVMGGGQDVVMKIKKNGDTSLECCVEDETGRSFDVSTISAEIDYE